MRILHVVKTTDGGLWAARQAVELAELGVELHVAVPRAEGRAMATWARANATVHVVDMDLRPRHPLDAARRLPAIRRLVADVRPDLIHSHFVSTTLMLRAALGPSHPTPRIFQVAGPLHLEHLAYRFGEIASAGPRDVWIASSRCILDHYLRAGVAPHRVFLSYLAALPPPSVRSPDLRPRFGLRADDLVVGNCSYMYAPKYYLGHRVGLKCHEDIIDAIGSAMRREPRVRGLLVGGAFGGATWYEDELRARARRVAGDRILLPGFLDAADVRAAWADFDCVVHVPLSENCGGVVEPLYAGTPVVASRIGGIPEVVMEGLTGRLVPARAPGALADAVLATLREPERARALAERGRKLVTTMFDNARTAAEVFAIYRHLLGGDAPPEPFDSRAHAESLA